MAPEPPDAPDEPDRSRRLPRWVVPATAVFWGGFLAAIAVRFFWTKLSDLVVLLFVSVFLSLAIEPGVNRLARRGWRRGTATALILFGVIFAFVLFVVAIGTLVASQVADLLSNSEEYIRDTVQVPQRHVRREPRRPGGHRRLQRPQRAGAGVHPRPAGQRRAALGGRPRRTAGAVLRAAVHVLPRRRRAEDAPGDLQPPHPGPPGAGAGDLGAGRDEDGRLPLLAGPPGPAVGRLPLDRVPVGGHRRAGRAGAVGRHRQPVPAGRGHVPGRGPAGPPDVPRLAAEGRDRADRHRALPADRELPVRTAHHRPHDGAAPGPRLRRRARRGGRARRHRGRARAAGGGDGPGVGQRGRRPPRRHQERPHRGPPPPGLEAGGPDPQRRQEEPDGRDGVPGHAGRRWPLARWRSLVRIVEEPS